MWSTIFIAVFALAIAAVSTQTLDISQAPPCASTCVHSSIGSTECPATDFSCICHNPQFIDTLTPCTRKECGLPDQQKMFVMATALCACYNVSISVPTTTAVNTSTAPAIATATASSSCLSTVAIFTQTANSFGGNKGTKHAAIDVETPAASTSTSTSTGGMVATPGLKFTVVAVVVAAVGVSFFVV